MKFCYRNEAGLNNKEFLDACLEATQEVALRLFHTGGISPYEGLMCANMHAHVKVDHDGDIQVIITDKEK